MPSNDSKPPRTHALGSDSLYYNKNTETQDHKTVRGGGGMGKFVSALCLQSCFWNLLAYAINCVYTRGVVLLGLNLQNLSLSDCLLKIGGEGGGWWSRFILIRVSISTYTTTYTRFGIWQSLLQQEHLNASKYTRENWLKQILKTTVESYKSPNPSE